MTPIDLASLKRKIRLLDLDDDCAADEVSKEELEALVAVVEAALAYADSYDDEDGSDGADHRSAAFFRTLRAALHPFSHINGEQPC